MVKGMKDAFVRVKDKNDYYDYNLLAVVILLTCFGLVMLYSTTAYMAELQFDGNDMYYFSKQAIISAVCIVIAIGVSFLDYHILHKLSGFILFTSIVLMVLVQSPLGVTVYGARRWLNLGIRFQPSEIAKIAAITYIPVIIIKMGKQFKGLKACMIPLGVGAILFLSAYIFTDNLSTAIIIMGIVCIIVFVAHPKTLPFLWVALGGILFLGIGIAVLHMTMEVSDSFRLQRILVWLEPEKYSEKGGYQILQALYALGSGGLFGKGLGNSIQKLGQLPEAQNDMIFSIVCEELGIFGAGIVIVLFGYLIYRLYFIARNASDLYGSLMVAGVMGHISIQVIFNLCVVLNIFPTTGITLPFISYGGTSILFIMLEMALVLSVSRQIKIKKIETNLWGEVIEYSS